MVNADFVRRNVYIQYSVKVLIHFPCAKFTGLRTLRRCQLKLVCVCLMINESAVYCLNDLHSFAIYCKSNTIYITFIRPKTVCVHPSKCKTTESTIQQGWSSKMYLYICILRPCFSCTFLQRTILRRLKNTKWKFQKRLKFVFNL